MSERLFPLVPTLSDCVETLRGRCESRFIRRTGAPEFQDTTRSVEDGIRAVAKSVDDCLRRIWRTNLAGDCQHRIWRTNSTDDCLHRI
jgi:hypothetical protein